ncbi:MAG: serine/threonine-protein kinase [Phycisphaerae bacterium]
MIIAPSCSTCHSPIPAGARTFGLCPRCLLRSAVASPGKSGGAGVEPPTVEELVGVLPGLEVLELIGRGGMGAVYRARQASLDRLVAVKLFPGSAADDPAFAQRFENEARILASLSHPGIVAAYEFGRAGGHCYLVMELVAGHSLRDRLDLGPLPATEALGIAANVCDALACAHGRGVIHRDVKPANILLQDGGTEESGASLDAPHLAWGAPARSRVRVADFGLAKLARATGSSVALSLTGPDRLVGTPDYMAPEQRRPGAVVDARADLYAVGVVLYEMLTGELPLGRFAPPTNDPAINALVLRCLEPSPDARPASAADLARELRSLAGRPAARPRPTRRVAAVAALLAVCLVPVGVVIYVRSGGKVDRGQTERAVAIAPASQPATRAAISPTPATARATATAPAAATARPVTTPPVTVIPHSPGLNAWTATDPLAHLRSTPWPPTAAEIMRRSGVPDPDLSRRSGVYVPSIHTPGAGTALRPNPLASGADAVTDFLARAERQFGPGQTVSIYITGVPAGGGKAIGDQLRAATKATQILSSQANDVFSVHLAPVADLDALAKTVDFGSVTRVDAEKRRIMVTAKPQK